MDEIKKNSQAAARKDDAERRKAQKQGRPQTSAMSLNRVQPATKSPNWALTNLQKAYLGTAAVAGTIGAAVGNVGAAAWAPVAPAAELIGNAIGALAAVNQ